MLRTLYITELMCGAAYCKKIKMRKRHRERLLLLLRRIINRCKLRCLISMRKIVECWANELSFVFRPYDEWHPLVF